MKLLGGTCTLWPSKKSLFPHVDLGSVLLRQNAGTFELSGVHRVGHGSWAIYDEGVFYIKNQTIFGFDGSCLPLKGDLQAYRSLCVGCDAVALWSRNEYSIFDHFGEPIWHGDWATRIDQILFVSSSLLILRSQATISAIDAQKLPLWELNLRKGSSGGTITNVVASHHIDRIYVGYGDKEIGKKLYCINLKTGQIISENSPIGSIRYRSVTLEDSACFFVDESFAYKLVAETGLIDIKQDISSSENNRAVAYTKNTICVMYQSSARLLVLDKVSLKILQNLKLGRDGHQLVAIASTDRGVALKVQPTYAQRQDEAAYGVFLSEEELLEGSLPDLTPEALEVSILESKTEDGFDVTINIHPSLPVGDFLRHVSFGLWNAAFEYGYYVNPFDQTESRPGNPSFTGRIVLDVSAYKFDEDQKSAFDAVINNAKQVMCGEGPARGCLWAGTQNGVNVSIEVKQ